MSFAAELGLILIEFQLEKMKEAEADDTGQSEQSATAIDETGEPVRSHHTPATDVMQAVGEE